MKKCEGCFYFIHHHGKEEVITICTREIIWDTTSDTVNFGYKKVDAEDMACEHFEQCERMSSDDQEKMEMSEGGIDYRQVMGLESFIKQMIKRYVFIRYKVEVYNISEITINDDVLTCEATGWSVLTGEGLFRIEMDAVGDEDVSVVLLRQYKAGEAVENDE